MSKHNYQHSNAQAEADKARAKAEAEAKEAEKVEAEAKEAAEKKAAEEAESEKKAREDAEAQAAAARVLANTPQVTDKATMDAALLAKKLADEMVEKDAAEAKVQAKRAADHAERKRIDEEVANTPVANYRSKTRPFVDPKTGIRFTDDGAGHVSPMTRWLRIQILAGLIERVKA